MQAYVFFVSQPIRTPDGTWQFSVASLRLQVHGPYPTRAAALRFRGGLEARWRSRARALSGSLRLETPTTWIVTVRDGTPVLGLRWFPDDGSAPPRKQPDPRDDPPIRLRLGPWKIV